MRFFFIGYTRQHIFCRLQRALASTKKTDIQHQAKTESKLLQTYGVTVPVNDRKVYSSSQGDQVSVQILNMFHPVMNTDYLPLETLGDGNCLYRAVSLALTDSQEHHSLNRLLSAIELIQNRQYYDTKKKHNDFLNDTRIVISNYDKLVSDALTDRCYSEMAHIYAISAALGITIHSYYPPQLNPELSNAFTRNISGRKVVDTECKVSLMWSSSRVPRVPKEFHVNHFVPFVHKSSCVTITEVTNTCTIPVVQSDEKCDEPSLVEDSPDFSSVVMTESGTDEDGLQCSSTNIHAGEEPLDRSDFEELSTSSPSISSDDPPKTSDTEGLAGSSNSDLPNIHDKLQGTLDNRFLDAGSVCSLLLNNKEGLPKIPGGLKENKYFILDNSSNKNKKGSKNSKSSTFSDDCGVWDRDAGTSPIS